MKRLHALCRQRRTEPGKEQYRVPSTQFIRTTSRCEAVEARRLAGAFDIHNLSSSIGVMRLTESPGGRALDLLPQFPEDLDDDNDRNPNSSSPHGSSPLTFGSFVMAFMRTACQFAAILSPRRAAGCNSAFGALAGAQGCQQENLRIAFWKRVVLWYLDGYLAGKTGVVAWKRIAAGGPSPIYRA